MSTKRVMVAKYPGRCCDCGKAINRGQTINFYGRGRAAHANCAVPDGAASRDSERWPCWICKSPEGRFRNMGAGAPVWCDACFETEKAKTRTVGNVRFTGSTEEETESYCEDEAAGLEPGTLANDRRLARRGLSVVRFSSGAVMTQNSKGRCEDAPCCGCCTY